MVLLANATISTSRSPYSASSGTGAPIPYLAGQTAHVCPVNAEEYKHLPASALEANIKIIVDGGTDIRYGDSITSILKRDGVTSWNAHGSNDFYIIKYIQESTPGFLEHRSIYVKHEVGGGVSYAGS